MPIPFIDLKAQYQTIQSEIDAAIREVIESTAFIGGRHAQAFEASFARYCGVSRAVGASSGTTALHLAFAALGIGPGDEVITVPNTFIATAEMISITGARPVFVDVEDATFNLDPAKLRAAITPRTKAIVPVHLYGQIADMDPILKIAREIPVVEDAAQAHGAEYRGRRAGQMGKAATYSFYPGKILGAYGDAGVVVTHDDALAKKMEMLANHGRTGKYEHETPAFNYRLDGMQAAILSVKLRHLDEWLERRRARAQVYTRLLEDAVVTPKEMPYARHVYTYYVIRTRHRNRVQAALKERGIDAIIHYPIPLHLQPAYKCLGHKKGDFPVAERQAEEILSLPLYAELEEGQIKEIVEVILSAV
ncbi:MAG: erythromycin biosynthesis sensory transduction protein eryC1 [Candidatus Handelsmanbacteria bacterium RIFCSPLOWO2_12_FULL_64_10]|uniref:Erythromycin biosynthesis sensory transduction protein eryC1 n=1 Tax=Handelsmanbacteria sp. (strain RIFCSPLOWO2_12_FULL_64_10) TaxID=1817868 RepID=A0A1F6CBV1_HANXR|nr:MAG: erythromycin biosynthesis sensory transduction protein eryC1 [Candidatus Handelsmanbacteria bacterium RIFCSPLOWO2_12_FULL_64_10]